jgi:hypothetical protein
MLIFEHYEEKNKAEWKKENKDRRGGRSGTRRRIRNKRTVTMWRTRRSETRRIMSVKVRERRRETKGDGNRRRTRGSTKTRRRARTRNRNRRSRGTG